MPARPHVTLLLVLVAALGLAHAHPTEGTMPAKTTPAGVERAMPGVAYHGGRGVILAGIQTRLVVPEGWIGQVSADGRQLVLARPGEPGRILVTSGGTSLDDLADTLTGPVALEPERAYVAVGSPERSDDRLTAAFAAPGEPAHKAVVEARQLGPDMVVAVIGIDDGDDAGPVMDVAGKVANALEWVPPASYDALPAGSSWRGELDDVTLAAEGAAVPAKQLALCADGHYAAGERGRTVERGRWTLRPVADAVSLELMTGDGRLRSYLLTRSGPHSVMLNFELFAIRPGAVCARNAP